MMPLWMTARRPFGRAVRVGVAVGRTAVGGPPGVADAGGATVDAGRRRGRLRRQFLLEVAELAGALARRQGSSPITATPAES